MVEWRGIRRGGQPSDLRHVAVVVPVLAEGSRMAASVQAARPARGECHMRPWPAAAISLALLAPLASADKLTLDDRVELTRGLTAEYATVKQFLPRSKKP